MGRPYDRRSWRRSKPFGLRCHWCGGWATEWDHLIALAQGGSSDPSNLVPSCSSCNYRRGAELSNRRQSLGVPSRPW
jgi:5-methylcytosine-specific restriction endonuclease McrA